MLQESSSVASGNGAVQMFFLTPNRNLFAGKFVNWESFLAVFWEHFVFNFIRVEICEITVVFWAKLYCKMSDIFRWLLLALRFSATNSGIKNTLMMSTGTWGLKMYARNNIFKKKELQIWVFESFIFWSKFRFSEDCFRVFFNFSSSVNHGGQHFYSTNIFTERDLQVRSFLNF